MKKKSKFAKKHLEKNQFNIFLSQLKLDKSVVYGNKDKGKYCINLNKKIDGFHKDIQQRIEVIKPDAVYFFNSQPLILFFDLTEQNRDLDKLYKQVWSFDSTSIIFIIKKTEIQVFNALNYVKNKKQNSLEEITLSQQEIKKLFNLWELESGKTWEWFQENYIDGKQGRDKKQRVNERLFSNIKKVREDLKQLELTENEANSLILRLIFIRYLIDRKIKIHDKLISGNVDELNERRKSFIQLIKQPQQLNELFKILNDRFNGVLFKETDVILTEKQAEYLSNVFSGEVDKEGLFKDEFFFEIFDFSIIPVEVISGIYESLIDKEQRNLDSAVYTPSFLVDYILKDTVDEFLKENKPEDCTVFEVAVGSGIFLVQSLRRIIEKEIELNGCNDNEAFAKKIRAFAENNLFGIDINKQALKVTCFSIYIALLDYQEPADIKKYKFPELIGKNLFEANFFDTNHQFNDVIQRTQPKFILGNPPWKNGKKDKKHVEYLTEENLLSVVSDYQISQSFVLRTKDFKDFEPTCSLIITSKAVHNNFAKSFKEYFLRENYLNSCLDLSAVRRFIFKDKKNPAIILNFKNSKHKDTGANIVNHFAIKSNSFLKNFKMLIIEKFDHKEILQRHFAENDWMFKVSLYGSTLDFYLLNRFNDFKSIGSKFDENGIKFSKGIFRGTPKNHYTELTGLPYLKRKDFLNYLTDYSTEYHRLDDGDCFLEAGRTKDLFLGKKIIIQKSTSSNIKFSRTNFDFVFDSTVYGVNFNNTDEVLFEIYTSILLSDFYKYFMFLNSSGWGIYIPEIYITEHKKFPFIDDLINKFEKFKKVNFTFFNPISEYYNKLSAKKELEFELKPSNIKEPKPPINRTALNQINNLINEIYEVKEHEKDLIDYVLNVSRYQFQESKQHLFTQKVDDKKNFLEKYAEVYLKEFSEIYTDEFIQVEIFPLKHFIAMNFVMKSKHPKETVVYSKNKNAESVLKTLANTLSISEVVNTSDPTKNLYIQKDIKGFDENSFYIIKPNEYKSWHRAMAWYDVAEFKEAIQKAEIDELNLNAE